MHHRAVLTPNTSYHFPPLCTTEPAQSNTTPSSSSSAIPDSHTPSSSSSASNDSLVSHDIWDSFGDSLDSYSSSLSGSVSDSMDEGVWGSEGEGEGVRQPTSNSWRERGLQGDTFEVRNVPLL